MAARRRGTDVTALVMLLIAVLGVPLAGYAAYYVLTNRDTLFPRPAPPPVAAAPAPTAPVDVPEEPKVREPVETRPAPVAPIGPPSNVAAVLRKLGDELAESLDMRKALVVWLLDTSASNQEVRDEAIREIGPLYDRLAKLQPPGDVSADALDNAPLLTLVGQYGPTVDFLTAEPTADPVAVQNALAGVKPGESPVENTFAAIAAAGEQALPYARQKGRYVMLVVVSDEVGDDQTKVDEVVAPLARNAIPVYVIGMSVPVGVAETGNPVTSMAMTSADGAAPAKGDIIVRGPDSRDPQWVRLAYPLGGLGGADGVPQIDSGLGPYSLERLCRETGGHYFALPNGNIGYSVGSSSGGSLGGAEMPGWAWSRSPGGARPMPTVTGTTMGSPATARARYTPNYIPEAEYQEMVSKNRAIGALLQATKLPAVEQLGGVQTLFTMTASEPDNARVLDQAMRPAARVVPAIVTLHDTLKAGESDRGKITDPRWQAAYDLALGRSMAARVRAEGYVNLLATFKGQRKFSDPSHTTWVLKPGEGVPGNSSLDSMAKKAKQYLEGVIQTHAGSPWAEAAQRELQVPIGWAVEEQ